MKTLVVGDVHSDTANLLRLLETAGAATTTYDTSGTPSIERTPGWNLICVGDLIHGGSDREADLECLEVGLEVFDTICIGNHELPLMFPDAGFPRWSGMVRPLTKTLHLLETAFVEEKYVAATHVDDWLITHAGLSSRYDYFVYDCGNTAEMVAELLRHEFWLRSSGPAKPVAVFDDVGRARGGRAECGGIFWCDWNELESNIPQVVGHTPQGDAPVLGRWSSAWNVDAGAKLSGSLAGVWRDDDDDEQGWRP